LPSDAVWLDLLNGSAEEKAFVERETGLRVPDLDSLREIESSSRLVADGEVLYLSMPIISRGDGPKPVVSVLGLVLSPKVLLTVRFAPIGSFDSFAGQFGQAADNSCSFGAFVGHRAGEHGPPGPRDTHRAAAGRPHRARRRSRLPAGRQLPGRRVPGYRPERGVAAPALRRTGPRPPRRPGPLVGPAISA